MKKHIFIILILTLFVACQNKKESTLIFDTAPAKKFIELIDYIESSSNQKLVFNEFSEQLIASNYVKNKADITLNTKIRDLLALDGYKKLNNDAIAFTDSSVVKGKEAYKLAFLNLPYKRTRMNGDRTYLWIDYWENNHQLEASLFLKRVNENSDSIKQEAIRFGNDYYPSNIVKIDTIQTIFCVDGYRSSFTSGNIIYMELIAKSDLDIGRFTKTLSHELHHINYGNWLLNNYEFHSDKKRGIYKLQKGIILEGIAQQINFIDYNKQIKSLYYNAALLQELNNDFIEDILRISMAKTPTETYNKVTTAMWGKSMALLKKYCKEEYEVTTVPRRPTYKYYISYQLYKVINKNGNKEAFKYVLEHPESLLTMYNKLRNDTNIIPAYSDEIVELWESNFLK